MPPAPLRRARIEVGLPPGFRFLPEAMGASEEAELVVRLDALALEEVRMRGVVARRRVLHFGWDYGYAGRSVRRGAELPAWLTPLRAYATAAARLDAEGDVDALEQALVTRYPPGAGIGWHRDAPMFGPIVVGFSLGAACVMRFRRDVGRLRHEARVALAPRSAYVIGGVARAHWQHAIPPVTATRYSVTFRSVMPAARAPRRPAGA